MLIKRKRRKNNDNLLEIALVRKNTHTHQLAIMFRRDQNIHHRSVVVVEEHQQQAK